MKSQLAEVQTGFEPLFFHIQVELWRQRPFSEGCGVLVFRKIGEKSFTKLWALDCWFSRTNDQRFFALKKGAAAKILLEYGKTEVQNPCHPWFHPCCVLRILRIKNCRTRWNDWLFRHFIYSVRQSWSRVRESNPPPRLGKPLYYRCTNPACLMRWYHSIFSSKMQPFSGEIWKPVFRCRVLCVFRKLRA